MPEPVNIADDTRPEGAPSRRRLPLGALLSFVVGLVGVAALSASAWVYNETQRELRQVSTDIAQFRLSLELYGRQQGAPAGGDAAVLLDLSNRLAILEDQWRSPAPVAAVLPELPAASSAAPANDGDCLPTGTRFLVAGGDSYPVCGIAGTVAIGAVDNGFISLSDGTVIAAGGNIGLPGTACMIGVVSAGENGMTGYAEIKVTC